MINDGKQMNLNRCAPATPPDISDIRRKVFKLQQRIAKAVRENRWGKVKALQRILTRSHYAKVVAVQNVTLNKGARTAGVDNVLWDTKAKRVKAVESLQQRSYQPMPLRRIYIKKRNGKKRPLSIPTIKDRAMQALYKLALEPVAETTADLNSYGFRQKRSCKDAIQQTFNCLCRKMSPKFILEADIEACFDRISHDWILENIPCEKKILSKWLKAGFVYKKELFPTLMGTPQGGVASPLIANLVLDGLEKVVERSTKYRERVQLVRYADDFIVTASSEEILKDKVIPAINNFLQIRGLKLSTEKTRIVHISEGFDFLSQNIRKYRDEKLLIKPSKTACRELIAKVKSVIRSMMGARPEELIRKLNATLRGWANYHKHVVSQMVFSKMDHIVIHQLYRWVRHRHPQKSRGWIKERYFSDSTYGHVFSARVKTEQTGKYKVFQIYSLGYVPIRRFIKIKAKANPFDPEFRDYFEKRKRWIRAMALETKLPTVVYV